MANDAPLLERLSQLDPVPAASALAVLQALPAPHQDPLLGPFFAVDDEGDAVVNALLPAVLQQFQDKGELTCYGALLEGLTGIWNAAVRTAVVAKLRASGLPADDLLLRLQALSPTLGFSAEKGDWAREWLADPFSRDLALVQQCVVRALLALRTMAEARAGQLLAAPNDPAAGADADRLPE
jgi:hypothetical protein